MAMAASTPGKCVLLVDDDRALLRLVEMWLTAGGYSVVACDSFGDAKHQLALSPPDLLLTDVRLGAFNGLQLVIFAKAQRPETVAIVISAFDDSTLRREAEQAGALYVLKPFTSEALLTSLAQAPRAAEV
jgi:DNA-binding NtrC family response regulator